MLKDLKEVCEARENLMRMVSSEICEGKEYLACHIEHFGQLVDAAKDMGELEEKMVKACYYKTIIEEMLDGEDEEESERFGYDNRRYANGRFAPKGKGHYAGYSDPFRANVRVHDPNYDGMIRMGYPMDGRMSGNEASRYGTSYDNYQMAKRHYSESRKDADKKMMDERIGDSVMDAIYAAKEMYKDASPETRKGMKDAFKKMLDEMV